MRMRRLIPLAALALAACGDDANAPRGALGRYVAIGASLTAGFMSDGLVYEGQSSAYPRLLARAAESEFVEARLQAPGCVPPLVAPLLLDRTLSGRRAFAAPRDSTCVGRFADSVFASNLAVPEMTTYQALRFTPDSAARMSDVRARRAMPEILLDGYSQVTQARLAQPTFVSVELGFSEIVRAIRSGRMTAATAETYRADTGFTYVPLDVWRPVFDSVMTALVDSARVRRGALVGLPRLEDVAALRQGSVLHAARDSLRAYGVAVAADCAGSTNRVHLAKVAAAAASAARAGAAQALSCADVAGAADSVLTAADLATLVSLRDAMGAHLGATATARGWVFIEWGTPTSTVPAYGAGSHLATERPFGPYVSLDGISPSALGHVFLVDALAQAITARYGIAISAPSGTALEVAR